MYFKSLWYTLVIQNAVSRLAAPPATSLGNLLDMHVIWPYHRPTEPESLWRKPEVCVLASSLGDSVMY